jgi:hypothetical protein
MSSEILDGEVEAGITDLALGFIRGSQISIGTGNLEGRPISLRDPEAGQTLHTFF